MTVYTHKERLAKKLIKAGGVLKQKSGIEGVDVSWTVECPREWFREPRLRAKRVFTAEQRAEAGARLHRSRNGGLVSKALVIVCLLTLPALCWAGVGSGEKILGPTLYYGALVGGDWALSHQAIRGGYSEANPVIRKVGFGPAKAIGVALMVGGYYALRRHKKTRWALSIGAGVGYGYLMVRAARKGR
jgi:hypothetical protein